MKPRKISLQFHCRPNEVPHLFSDLLHDSAVWVTIENKTVVEGKILLSYTSLTLEERVDIANYVSNGSGVNLYFTIGEPAIRKTEEGGGNAFDFAIKNPNYLLLTIGTETKKDLEESWLTTMTQDKAIFSKWNTVVTSCKKMMHCGATAVSTKTGATSVDKNHWYTDGALELSTQGVLMKSTAPLVVFDLHKS